MKLNKLNKIFEKMRELNGAAKMLPNNYLDSKGEPLQYKVYQLKNKFISLISLMGLWDRTEVHKIGEKFYECFFYKKYSFHQPINSDEVGGKDINSSIEIKELVDFEDPYYRGSKFEYLSKNQLWNRYYSIENFIEINLINFNKEGEKKWNKIHIKGGEKR